MEELETFKIGKEENIRTEDKSVIQSDVSSSDKVNGEKTNLDYNKEMKESLNPIKKVLRSLLLLIIILIPFY